MCWGVAVRELEVIKLVREVERLLPLLAKALRVTPVGDVLPDIV
jgi:hypothetical protein